MIFKIHHVFVIVESGKPHNLMSDYLYEFKESALSQSKQLPKGPHEVITLAEHILAVRLTKFIEGIDFFVLPEKDP